MPSSPDPAAPSQLDIIVEAPRAVSALHPLRRRLLQALAEPDSAAGLARRLGLARQKVNYHLRRLEADGLVAFVEERAAAGGNLPERVFRATARRYLLAPSVLGSLAGSGPADDAFSPASLALVAARALDDLARLGVGAPKEARVPTLALEAEVRFALPTDQAAFAAELTRAVGALVARYHDPDAPGGRTFRILLGGHPLAPETAG